MLSISLLNPQHDRSDFSCGEPILDDYLQRKANQDSKRGLSKVYILTQNEASAVLGFYTLSSGSVIISELSESEQKKLPRYPIPTLHLGRLAVHQAHKGKGFGKFLLIDALFRTLKIAETMGVYALEVFAKDENAKAFYIHYGFKPFRSNPLHLYMPLKQIANAFLK